MIDSDQLLEYAQHPELAVQNLLELLSFVESEDETLQSYASEALENCGPPKLEQIPSLQAILQSENSSQIYWACTLLGRLGTKITESSIRLAVHQSLANVAERSSLSLASRERSVWAISELGSVDPVVKARLNLLLSSASPRLKRLLESV
jgi:hypothetical protein